MLRRLYHDQPVSFAFTPANQAWAEGQIAKYPEGRQASAIIPLLWRAQEQEGWLSRPAIEHVANRLGMAYIRALEVATFYFMFQLQPVGSVAHVQVCGTLSCMLCGSEDLMQVCKDKIAPHAHDLSADGKFSWEEVECLGSCSNAPMAQIGKDYYEDLTAEKLSSLLDQFAAGRVPVPGPQNGRYAAEPLKGLTSLTALEGGGGRSPYNASVQLAVDIGDTVKRIDGTEVPLVTPWIAKAEPAAPERTAPTPEESGPDVLDPDEPEPGRGHPADETGVTVQEHPTPVDGKPEQSDLRASAAMTQGTPPGPVNPSDISGVAPELLTQPRGTGADDLKRVIGIGPKLEKMLNEMGFWHFDQIAAWTPEQVAWVNSRLGTFKGRIERDDWIEQSRKLGPKG